MQTRILNKPTLVSTIWPTASESTLRTLLLVVFGSLLLTVSAKISVPFYPVPLTMQTFAVLVIGMAFGPHLAIATVGVYLLQGAFGLPVFAGTPAKGIGWAYMIGPTGGYLLGFLIAAGVVSFLAQRGFDRSFARTLVAMFIGTATIYVPGFAWLAGIIGADKAWTLGVQPFLLADGFKIVLAAIVLPAAWKLVGRKSDS